MLEVSLRGVLEVRQGCVRGEAGVCVRGEAGVC